MSMVWNDNLQDEPVILSVSLKTIPLVVISPTIRLLSAEAMLLPDSSKNVDKLAIFFIKAL